MGRRSESQKNFLCNAGEHSAFERRAESSLTNALVETCRQIKKSFKWEDGDWATVLHILSMLLKKRVLVYLLLNVPLKNYFLVILAIICMLLVYFHCGQEKYFMILILDHLLEIALLSSIWSILVNLCAFENILHYVFIACWWIYLLLFSLCLSILKVISLGVYKFTPNFFLSFIKSSL